ncbi:MAG: glycoside hydrolase family 127 protein [Eubacterium sp.]|nr:glycoside hydrolase family 127 protein [Eubacterium sp.]
MNLKAYDIKEVTVNDKFWSYEQKLVRDKVLPYQWDILNDRVPEATPSYCMHNFIAAGKLNKRRNELGKKFIEPKFTYRGFEALPEDPKNPKDDEFYGFVFQDSDFSKWIEAVGYTLATHPDTELEKIADEAIDIVCDAQLPNGYLDTYYIINGMDRSFTDLRDHHELYCLGHLIEGAVSYYKGTGKDKLLKAASRFADYVDSVFGPEEGKLKGYPGHEIAEMALFKLYETTGEERYKKLAEYFIDERGAKPLYFDMEHPTPKGQPYKIDFYHQAHIPVREQDEAVGHAVRAVYLYSGMADMARISGDEKLLSACEKLWNSITNEKMYITGGIGATHMGESFSFPYDLPNDTAYAETCASIGLVFFARRMLQLKADRRYSDVMELALYNGILSGMSLDGKSFFYVNPLEVLPEACHKDERKFHVKPVRQKWFGCACCPPNLARLISSIGTYAYTKSDDTLYVHLYMGSKLSIIGTDVEIESTFPESGKVTVRTKSSSKEPVTIAFRIPGWCNDTYTVTGTDKLETSVKDGYMYVSGITDNDITFDFEMKPAIVTADPRVREDAGRYAVIRGPVVYCMEEKDNGKNLRSLNLNTDSAIREEITDEFGLPVTVLYAEGYRTILKPGEIYISSLYQRYTGIETNPQTIRLIPYRLWANRGEGEMSVFI